jgi:hypothetical protein
LEEDLSKQQMVVAFAAVGKIVEARAAKVVGTVVEMVVVGVCEV